MSQRDSEDSIYAKRRDYIADFEFDDSVAQVFPDMIRRSVPGYGTVIANLGLFAERFVQADSHIYDLGASLGAASLSMRRRIRQPGCRIIAVDNSESMAERCRSLMEEELSDTPVEVICGDIRDVVIENASLVVLNFTLQFLTPEERPAVLRGIYEGLRPGGALVLSEKITFADEAEAAFQVEMHHAFKRANGYSDLEISQKRSALENVLVPDTLPQHEQRLHEVGFARSDVWFQCFNFASICAVK